MIMTIVLAFLIVLLCIAVFATLSFNRRINQEITNLISKSKSEPRTVITEEMLKNLPPPVQRYMIYSGVLGKAIPRTVRLKQVGKIRQDEKSAWMKLEAVENYSTTPPGCSASSARWHFGERPRVYKIN